MPEVSQGLPGITPKIFKEFIQELIGRFVEDSHQEILKVYKGKRHYFSYQLTDLGSFDIEVTETGDHVVHWEPTGKARLQYIADSVTFDDVMTNRIAPFDAFFRRSVKVKGSVGEAIKLLAMVPALQKAYIKTRGEIAERYGLYELNAEYPIPEKLPDD
jgi:putative sterol carrier protein